MAVKEPPYSVITVDGDFEIREYASYCVAETYVRNSDFDDASSEGFKRLFKFISGENTSKTNITMTAPVTASKSEKIEMTAPVTSAKSADGYLIGFVMPEEFSMETIPVPDDSSVHLREVPARRIAVIRFSGRWTSSSMEEHERELKEWLSKNTLTYSGESVIARYDPPFMPWFLRRNEIQLEIMPLEE